VVGPVTSEARIEGYGALAEENRYAQRRMCLTALFATNSIRSPQVLTRLVWKCGVDTDYSIVCVLDDDDDDDGDVVSSH
jgi:hypothetical protein